MADKELDPPEISIEVECKDGSFVTVPIGKEHWRRCMTEEEAKEWEDQFWADLENGLI